MGIQLHLLKCCPVCVCLSSAVWYDWLWPHEISGGGAINMMLKQVASVAKALLATLQPSSIAHGALSPLLPVPAA